MGIKMNNKDIKLLINSTFLAMVSFLAMFTYVDLPNVPFSIKFSLIVFTVLAAQDRFGDF